MTTTTGDQAREDWNMVYARRLVDLRGCDLTYALVVASNDSKAYLDGIFPNIAATNRALVLSATPKVRMPVPAVQEAAFSAGTLTVSLSNAYGFRQSLHMDNATDFADDLIYLARTIQNYVRERTA